MNQDTLLKINDQNVEIVALFLTSLISSTDFRVSSVDSSMHVSVVDCYFTHAKMCYNCSCLGIVS